MAIKLTSWSIEHADGLTGASVDLPTRQRREDWVRETLREINCDILCLIETAAQERRFEADVLNSTPEFQ